MPVEVRGTKDISFFRSPSGDLIVAEQSGDSPGLAVSSHGGPFVELLTTGRDKSSERHFGSFEVPTTGVTRYFERIGDRAYFNGELLERVPVLDAPASINVVPLPIQRTIEYLVRTDEGLYVCVTSDHFHYTYETFRAFVGTELDNLVEVAVRDVQRFHDGGSTYVYTEAGMLSMPVDTAVDTDSKDPHDQPGFAGAPFTRLNTVEYTVTETEGGACVTHGISHAQPTWMVTEFGRLPDGTLIYVRGSKQDQLWVHEFYLGHSGQLVEVPIDSDGRDPETHRYAYVTARGTLTTSGPDYELTWKGLPVTRLSPMMARYVLTESQATVSIVPGASIGGPGLSTH